jgi:hypothetical protein
MGKEMQNKIIDEANFEFKRLESNADFECDAWETAACFHTVFLRTEQRATSSRELTILPAALLVGAKHVGAKHDHFDRRS